MPVFSDSYALVEQDRFPQIRHSRYLTCKGYCSAATMRFAGNEGRGQKIAGS
jgi:hypothetical protein